MKLRRLLLLLDLSINKFKKRSLKTVMYLVKEFEQKKSAALYARASSDKTGVLDPLKLHSIQNMLMISSKD